MLQEAIDFILNQSLLSFFANFWFVLVLEIPRYIVGAFAVIIPIIQYSRWRSEEARPQDDHFEVSIVIPGHNDGPSMEKTAISLREQIGVVSQIILVNDGSTDDTHELCLKLVKHGLADDYIHLESRGGKAAAVNAALERAHFQFFLVTDSDTTFDRDALNIGLRYFDNPRVGAVAGNLRVRNMKQDLCTRVQQINYMSSISVGRIVKDALGFYFVASGAFALYRTELCRTIGGWDFGPGEDGDIATRLRLAGYRVRFAPMAIAMTHAPETFERLARQRLRWDRSMIRIRFRKFRTWVLNPFSANFRPMLALSFFEIYFVQGCIPFFFFMYLIQLFYLYGSFALVFVICVQLIYITLAFIKFSIALSISTHMKDDIGLYPYVPLYSLVNVYLLRMVKLYATTNELVFRGSYSDQYVPKKVRDRIHRY